MNHRRSIRRLLAWCNSDTERLYLRNGAMSSTAEPHAVLVRGPRPRRRGRRGPARPRADDARGRRGLLDRRPRASTTPSPSGSRKLGYLTRDQAAGPHPRAHATTRLTDAGRAGAARVAGHARRRSRGSRASRSSACSAPSSPIGRLCSQSLQRAARGDRDELDAWLRPRARPASRACRTAPRRAAPQPPARAADPRRPPRRGSTRWRPSSAARDGPVAAHFGRTGASVDSAAPARSPVPYRSEAGRALTHGLLLVPHRLRRP